MFCLKATDTTAITISTTVLMLAMHPQYQQRCFDELIKILPDKMTDITREHLDQMIYTEQCIKESLRLLPTVPTIGRSVNQDIKLKNITIPAGLDVVVAVRQIMRKKEYWGVDAYEYNPDHFSAENLAEKHPLMFIPFSEGARNCVGMSLSFYSLKLL